MDVQVTINSSSTPSPAGILVARLLTDVENVNWNYMSRTDPLNPRYVKAKQVPQTVKYDGDTGQIALDEVYRPFFESLNTPEAIKYNDRNGGGWHNRGSSVRQVLFANDVVKVLGVEGKRVYFEHYIKGTSPTIRDYLLHEFTVVNPDGSTEPPPCGRLVVFGIARKQCYFNISNVELFTI